MPAASACSLPARLFVSLAFAWLLFAAGLAMGKVGGREDIPGAQNDVYLEELAKYAVDQQNINQNSALEYVSLKSAQQQVVAGIMYNLVIEAAFGGETKLYEAKVWVKAWQNFKSLECFKEVQSSVTPADLGTNLNGPADNSSEAEAGLQPVSSDDPVVKEAAEEALKGLQQRSNCLIPYELKQVLSAHAEVTEDSTNFEILLKVQRGSKEEQFKAEVSRSVLGLWAVKDVRRHE